MSFCISVQAVLVPCKLRDSQIFIFVSWINGLDHNRYLACLYRMSESNILRAADIAKLQAHTRSIGECKLYRLRTGILVTLK